MLTIKQAIIKVVAEKLREYYLRGVRDARVELEESSMPSFYENFDAGNFDEAQDQHVWMRIAENILDI